MKPKEALTEPSRRLKVLAKKMKTFDKAYVNTVKTMLVIWSLLLLVLTMLIAQLSTTKSYERHRNFIKYFVATEEV